MNEIVNFKEYQEHVKQTNKTDNEDILIYGLVGEVGEILTAFKKNKLHAFDGFENELKEELGDTFWYLSALADKYNICLTDIAKENIKKAKILFDEGELRYFDKKYPENERFLRKFAIKFIVDKTLKTVKMKMGDCFISDPITDNSYNDDYYRYHDAFHLAYVAVLGWSPVIRKMLKRKRKSQAKVDEIEDGARAAIIEEAISILVFTHAEKRNYYENNPKKSDIEFKVIKIIMLMVRGLEVEKCTATEWRQAILLGYEIFNKLKKNEGGELFLNLDERQITFEES